MNTELLPTQEKRRSIGWIFCIVTACVVAAFGLLTILTSLIETVTTIANYAPLFEDDLYELDSLIRCTIMEMIVSGILNIGVQLATCLWAFPFVMMGVCLFFKNNSKALPIAALIGAALSFIPLVFVIGGDIINSGMWLLFDVQTALTRVIGYVMNDFIEIASYICLTVCWLVVAFLAMGKKKPQRSKAVSIVAAIIIAVAFGLSVFGLAVSGVWTALIATLSRLNIGFNIIYVIRYVGIPALQSVLGLVRYGSFGILYALTFFFVTKWIIDPFKKIKATEAEK